MSKKTYITTTRIMHDGEVFEPGDDINLEEAVGEKHRLAGRVKSPKPETDAEGNTSPDAEPAKKGTAKKPAAKKPDGDGGNQSDGEK